MIYVYHIGQSRLPKVFRSYLHDCVDCGRVKELKRVDVPFDPGNIDKGRAVTGHVVVRYIALLRRVRGHPLKDLAIFFFLHEVAVRIEFGKKRSENERRRQSVGLISERNWNAHRVPTVTECGKNKHAFLPVSLQRLDRPRVLTAAQGLSEAVLFQEPAACFFLLPLHHLREMHITMSLLCHQEHGNLLGMRVRPRELSQRKIDKWTEILPGHDALNVVEMPISSERNRSSLNNRKADANWTPADSLLSAIPWIA